MTQNHAQDLAQEVVDIHERWRKEDAIREIELELDEADAQTFQDAAPLLAQRVLAQDAILESVRALAQDWQRQASCIQAAGRDGHEAAAAFASELLQRLDGAPAITNPDTQESHHG